MSETTDTDIVREVQESRLEIMSLKIERDRLLRRIEQKEDYNQKLKDSLAQYEQYLSKTYEKCNNQLEGERLDGDLLYQSQKSKYYSLRANYHELQFLYGVEV